WLAEPDGPARTAAPRTARARRSRPRRWWRARRTRPPRSAPLAPPATPERGGTASAVPPLFCPILASLVGGEELRVVRLEGLEERLDVHLPAHEALQRLAEGVAHRRRRPVEVGH